MKPAIKKILNRVNSRGNPLQKLILFYFIFFTPAVVCLLFLTAGIVGTEPGAAAVRLS